MKQKDEIDILYVALFVNACLTDRHFFGSNIFIAELKNFKISAFFMSTGLKF